MLGIKPHFQDSKLDKRVMLPALFSTYIHLYLILGFIPWSACWVLVLHLSLTWPGQTLVRISSPYSTFTDKPHLYLPGYWIEPPLWHFTPVFSLLAYLRPNLHCGTKVKPRTFYWLRILGWHLLAFLSWSYILLQIYCIPLNHSLHLSSKPWIFI